MTDWWLIIDGLTDDWLNDNWLTIDWGVINDLLMSVWGCYLPKNKAKLCSEGS